MEQKRIKEIRKAVDNAKEVGLTGANMVVAVHDEYCKVVPELLEEIDRLTAEAEEWRGSYMRMKEQWKHDCELLVNAGAELAEYRKTKEYDAWVIHDGIPTKVTINERPIVLTERLMTAKDNSFRLTTSEAYATREEAEAALERKE